MIIEIIVLYIFFLEEGEDRMKKEEPGKEFTTQIISYFVAEEKY